MNEFKSTKKDQAFEDLIKELQPITKKSFTRDFGSGGEYGTSQFNKSEKQLSEHTLRFKYKGYKCIVELK